jgi:hypothetical protein
MMALQEAVVGEPFVARVVDGLAVDQVEDSCGQSHTLASHGYSQMAFADWHMTVRSELTLMVSTMAAYCTP